MMGSAGKLSKKNKEVKLQTRPSPGSRIYSGKIKKLGPYLPFRHPLNPFFCNKSGRKAPGLRASIGYRNYYSWYWRRDMLKTRDLPLRVFSLNGAVKVSDAFKKHKQEPDAKTAKQISFERKIVDNFAKEKKKETLKLKDELKTEKSVEVKREPEKPAIISLPIAEKTIAEKPMATEIKVSKNVEKREDKLPEITEVKTENIQTLKTPTAKIVTKSVKGRKTETRVYKTVATTKSPRTSTFKVHAEDGRRSVGKPPNTSNSDFAWVVPPFSLFSISVKSLKMNPESISRIQEIKTPETVPKPKTISSGRENDSYHITNRARNKLVFQKVASAAADAIN